MAPFGLSRRGFLLTSQGSHVHLARIQLENPGLMANISLPFRHLTNLFNIFFPQGVFFYAAEVSPSHTRPQNTHDQTGFDLIPPAYPFAEHQAKQLLGLYLLPRFLTVYFNFNSVWRKPSFEYYYLSGLLCYFIWFVAGRSSPCLT